MVNKNRYIISQQTIVVVVVVVVLSHGVGYCKFATTFIFLSSRLGFGLKTCGVCVPMSNNITRHCCY